MGYLKATGLLVTIITFLMRIVGCDSGGLDPGVTAPALDVAEWIQGEPQDVTDGAHIYVVEFWASWCPFCRDAVPTMTALHNDFADCGVVVIAVSTEDAEAIRAYVDDQGEAMPYIVAADNNSASALAYEVSTIPRAFLIDTNGIVVWEGHPESPILRERIKNLCNR